MSFLDNLENNLNALERIEEKDPEKLKREQERRESERRDALLRGPHVEALKTSAFTQELLGQLRVVGREFRVLPRFTWIEEVLRIDAGTKRMEFVPTAKGIEAVMSADGVEKSRGMVDVEKDDAEKLAREFLSVA